MPDRGDGRLGLPGDVGVARQRRAALWPRRSLGLLLRRPLRRRPRQRALALLLSVLPARARAGSLLLLGWPRAAAAFGGGGTWGRRRQAGAAAAKGAGYQACTAEGAKQEAACCARFLAADFMFMGKGSCIGADVGPVGEQPADAGEMHKLMHGCTHALPAGGGAGGRAMAAAGA